MSGPEGPFNTVRFEEDDGDGFQHVFIQPGADDGRPGLDPSRPIIMYDLPGPDMAQWTDELEDGQPTGGETE